MANSGSRCRKAFPPQFRALIKRVVDLVSAVTLLVVLSPLMALIAMCLHKGTSRGPVFYGQ